VAGELDRALDPHLHVHRGPVDAQRCDPLPGELAALAALAVGIEDEAALVEAPHQHDACARQALPVDRAQRAGVGVFRLGDLRLREAGREAFEGFLEGSVHDVKVKRRVRVLFVASEVAPFSKTGGLADVAGALPQALAARGIDVLTASPLWPSVPRQNLADAG